MRVRSRRQAREAALSALYLIELGRERPETVFEHLEAFRDLPDELRAFAERLVRGVLQDRENIDARISAKLQEWKLSRVAVVDRNVLRLACFELYDVPDVPPKVTLDEAVELAKKFSTAESGGFVNGVLAAVLLESPKAEWCPPAAEAVEEAAPAAEPEPAAEEIAAGSEEAEELARVGLWKIRTEEEPR